MNDMFHMHIQSRHIIQNNVFIHLPWLYFDHDCPETYLHIVAVNTSGCYRYLLDARQVINSLRSRPNRRHFADDIFKCIFENENEWISPRISLKFVPKFRINNIPALVQIMARRRPGDKLLSEPMMVSLLTHICVTRPQWVKTND